MLAGVLVGAVALCFNEAAGIHRRKLRRTKGRRRGSRLRFNEAAGIHRRKLGGWGSRRTRSAPRFNEAAGIHRRKPSGCPRHRSYPSAASMRPPEFTGGNRVPYLLKHPPKLRFNEAAGIHRRKRADRQQ